MIAVSFLFLSVACAIIVFLFFWLRFSLRVPRYFEIKDISFESLTKRVREIIEEIDAQTGRIGFSRMGVYLVSFNASMKIVNAIYISEDGFTAGTLKFIKKQKTVRITFEFESTDNAVTYLTGNTDENPFYQHPLADIKLLTGSCVNDLWRYHMLRTEHFRRMGIMQPYGVSGRQVLEQARRKELKFMEEDRYVSDAAGVYLTLRPSKVVSVLQEKIFLMLTKKIPHRELNFPYTKDDIFSLKVSG